MFICYCDESGYNGKRYNSEQPVMVIAGIQPNLYNYHKSNFELNEVFHILKEVIPVKEIKAYEIYRKKGSWRTIDPETRDKIIKYYLDWLKDRNHKIILSAVDNKSYFDLIEKEADNLFLKTFTSPYLFASTHIALVIQRLNKKLKSNKGKTLLIYDEQSEFENELSDIIYCPPDFIDDFVEFEERTEKYRLNQIIDSAYFVKSHHSTLAQAVDVVAFFYRLYLELNFYGVSESYSGEKIKVNNWIKIIEPCFVDFTKIYPIKKNPFNNFINSIKAKGM